jgi:ribonuclease Z
MLAADIDYRMTHHDDLTWAPTVELHEVAPPERVTVGDATVIVGSTDHRPVQTTVGYRIEHHGSAIVVAGDGVPCGGLDELCLGADVYVQTVIRADLVRTIPSPRLQDIVAYHSTIEQAAQTAARGGVATLVATHFVPPPAGDHKAQWRSAAAEHFGGTIILADDLTPIEVP